MVVAELSLAGSATTGASEGEMSGGAPRGPGECHQTFVGYGITINRLREAKSNPPTTWFICSLLQKLPCHSDISFICLINWSPYLVGSLSSWLAIEIALRANFPAASFSSYGKVNFLRLSKNVFVLYSILTFYL